MEGLVKIKEINTIDPHWTFRSCLLGNTIIRWHNRKWKVKLPKDCGTAKFVGGGFACEENILDLSQATLGVPGTELITVDVNMNGVPASMEVVGKTPVPH